MEINPNHIIIGMGEIGQGIRTVIGPCLTFDKQNELSGFQKQNPPRVPVMHVAFPYSKTFTKDVMGYVEKYKPELVIIYSTVPIGTTKKLGENFVHSPVEGKHPYLAKSIKKAPRWLGSTDEMALKRAANFWAQVVDKVHMVNDSDHTEFVKLRSTSRFGVNLAFARYEKEVADKIGMDWNELMEFDRDYNQLYQDLGLEDMQRYVLKPPGEKIGGHCVVPNAEMLNEQHPNKWLEEIK